MIPMIRRGIHYSNILEINNLARPVRKVDYYQRFGAAAPPLTLTTMATNYMNFVLSVDGRLDQFLYADPYMWCGRDPLC